MDYKKNMPDNDAIKTNEELKQEEKEKNAFYFTFAGLVMIQVAAATLSIQKGEKDIFNLIVNWLIYCVFGHFIYAGVFMIIKWIESLKISGKAKITLIFAFAPVCFLIYVLVTTLWK